MFSLVLSPGKPDGIALFTSASSSMSILATDEFPLSFLLANLMIMPPFTSAFSPPRAYCQPMKSDRRLLCNLFRS